jgi:molecular chaperone Hsp33
LNSDNIAGCLQGYFENSEQLPTRLWLHADEKGVSGLLLQRLSEDTSTRRGAGEAALAAEEEVNLDDAWDRVQLLAETLKLEELQTLTDRQILRRLFAEDDVRMFEPTPVFFRCRCSRERVSGMLKGLGAVEIRSLLEERGNVEVRCDFCNRAYTFDAVDIEQLFSDSLSADRSSSVH